MSKEPQPEPVDRPIQVESASQPNDEAVIALVQIALERRFNIEIERRRVIVEPWVVCSASVSSTPCCGGA